MKVQIVGTGIVGEATACLATSLGHSVFGYDIKNMRSEYYISGLTKDADIVFICVSETVIDEAIADLINQKIGGLYIIRSSTKPRVTEGLSNKYNIHICHNPEFLRETTYLEDSINPQFVLVGMCCEKHRTIIDLFYSKCTTKIIYTTTKVSEWVKLVINNYLAVLITFWNEVNKISEKLGISTAEVANIALNDNRVSIYGTKFFGSSFGGKCLPKDLQQTIDLAYSLGLTPEMLKTIQIFNEEL